ncbi:hypothetical protein RDI58_013589 [Solanum bulbocastanum]|uniref:Uncharacterized protein n=1 Tax=Solanum bulbocastanum TaxID=147425 RepID=A0AAN8YE46_SOLBU
MNNMPMWPESRNPLVAPPVIKKMPSRPKKLRRKEAGETKGNRELPLLQMLKNHQVQEREGEGEDQRPTPRTIAPLTNSRTPRHKANASVSGAGVSSRVWSGRGRGRELGSASKGINHPLESWFTCSQGNTTQGVDQNRNVAPKETATAKKGKGIGNTTQFKRPRVTGMGVFQAENGSKLSM